jgi:hypothetical protein
LRSAATRWAKAALRVGLIDQWAADAQRKGDERAARWQQRQQEKAVSGQMNLMDRWVAHGQRKGDERAARWQQRQQEKAVSGQMTLMDHWAARAQRKGDETAARWLELEPIRQLVASGPVSGPGGSTAVITVDQSGLWAPRGAVVPTGGGGGALLLAYLLIALAIWWVVFRRSYTVHVRTNGYPPKVHARLPNELAAYRAAAELVSRFQAEGLAALESWRADITA